MDGPRPSLAALAAVIARDANLTFGGGSATAEVLRRSLAKRGWLSDENHRRAYGASRLTPGTNLLAYCTGVGWQMRGATGATVGWLASSTPASLIAVGATAAYDSLAESHAFAIVVLTATAVAIVLLLASAWHLARPHLAAGPISRSVLVIGVVLVLLMVDAPPIVILLIAGLIGCTWRPQVA